MEKKDVWFTNRVSFVIKDNGSMMFQKIGDKRSCTDWLREDYAYRDVDVYCASRGHIISGEICFFQGKMYDGIEEGLISFALMRVIRKHDEVFGKHTIVIANGKIPGDEFENWENKEVLGVWTTKQNSVCD